MRKSFRKKKTPPQKIVPIQPPGEDAMLGAGHIGFVLNMAPDEWHTARELATTPNPLTGEILTPRQLVKGLEYCRKYGIIEQGYSDNDLIYRLPDGGKTFRLAQEFVMEQAEEEGEGKK